MPFESLDLEQHEILLRLHPRRAGGDFADAKKASYLIAEIREGSIIDRTQGHGGHAPESIYHLMICFRHFMISLVARSSAVVRDSRAHRCDDEPEVMRWNGTFLQVLWRSGPAAF